MHTPTSMRTARRDWRPWLAAYGFLLPALAFYLSFLIVPVVQSLWISTFSWDGVSQATPVGAANYRSVLTDPLIRESVRHALVFIVFYAGIPVLLALAVVGTISRVEIRGLAVFRAALFVPYILSSVVIAISWRWIYAENGPLNTVLRSLGLDSLARAWLGDFGTALPAVGFIGSWVMFGLAFVLFVSGVQRIPGELFEAARVDGAGPVREFLAVTLPGLRGEIRVALVLVVTAALRNFDIVWNTTAGGPGTTTTVPSYYVYREAFVVHSVGRASALAALLTVLILALVGVLLWLTAPERSLRIRRRPA